MLSEQKPVMLSHVARESIDQCLRCTAEPLAAQRSQLMRMYFSSDHRFQHASPAGSQNVRNYRTKLDIGFFQNRLNTLRVLRNLAGQLFPCPGQIAQFLNSSRRHEARADQSMRQQVRKPTGIIHVTLSSRHRLHMRCIRQDQCKTPVENVPDRLPIDAGRFHRYMRTSRTFEPFREFKQSVRRRGKSTHLTLHLSMCDKANQRYPRGRRLVLYDAEGDFDRNFDWWKESGQHRLVEPQLPFENGRSDLLAGSGSRLDIQNINLFATLLVHAQYQGYWSQLGMQFEEEMEALLERHVLKGLVDAPWVRTDDPES